MKDKIIFLNNYLKAYLNRKNSNPENIRQYLAKKDDIYTSKEINYHIANLIKSNQPFMVGRFGANELSAIKTFDFEISSKYDITMEYLASGAGFFPKDTQQAKKFTEMMINLIPEVDIMGIWMLPFENYYLNRYGSENLHRTYLLDLEPWSSPDAPWSAALKGKKVLVIHPFAETIQKQYYRREQMFVGTEILPEFELKTLKAVQTSAGEQDQRFATWFDALEWMYQEALKFDFDIAIIGCGAYGFPLAAKLKQAGKQAIHLAGATQLLFGIKGKRWEESKLFFYVQKYFNDAWVRPGAEEAPTNRSVVEGGCYW